MYNYFFHDLCQCVVEREEPSIVQQRRKDFGDSIGFVNCFLIYKLLTWDKLIINLLTCKMEVSRGILK